MRRLLLLLAGLLAILPSARADDAELIRALGADTHAAREAAEKALWRRADEALPSLRIAAESDDPEVATRAARLVRLVANGIYPDTPPEVADKLRRLPSLPLEEMSRTVATNLSDRALGPRLLRRAIGASRQRGEDSLFAALLRPHLREPLLRLAAEGREQEAADLLLIAARGGLETFASPAADAAWLLGALDRLEARVNPGPAEPGDGRVLAVAAFHRGDHAAAAALARASGPESLDALCSALGGDWSRLDRLPWWNEVQRRNDLDTSRLARARLRGDPEVARAAVEEAIGFARENPDDQWYALEILLVNDAWPSLPAFFAATSNALLEADYAYEFFQPAHLARVASNAWAEADNPNLRFRLLTWSRALTGVDPTDNRSEVRVAEQFGKRPVRAKEEDEDPDWEAFRDQLAGQLKQTPTSVGTMLLLGWAESRLGHADTAAAWRRRAGWHLILRGDFDPSRLNDTLFQNPDDPHWKATVEMIHHLRRNEPDFLPFLERTFEHALAGGPLGECIGWLELGRLRFLSPARSYTGLQGYLFHARRLAELHIRFALDRGDEAAALALARAHLDILLHESTEIHARLAASKHPAFAATFAETAFDRMAERLKPYPKAVEMRNNAAWLAALARRRLPEALALLDAAGPDLPAHTLDTRAELLFQLGRDAEALTLAERNAKAAPDDPYFQRQAARMRAGDRASAPK